MSLGLIVGALRGTSGPDDESRAYFDHELAKVNRALAAEGIPVHVEPVPAEADDFDGLSLGYIHLHALRRLAAHLGTGQDPKPFPPGSNPTEDSLLRAVQSTWPSLADGPKTARRHRLLAGRFDHLLFHGDSDGMYLLIDFDRVVFYLDTFLGTGTPRPIVHAVGSTQHLLRELDDIAAWLDLPLETDPDGPGFWPGNGIPSLIGPRWRQFIGESFACLRLHRACRRSVEKGMALLFT